MPITMIILLLGLLGASEINGLHFTVKDKATNKNCLILEANITGTIQYVNTSNATVSLPFQVSEDGSAVATEDSVCGSDVDKLQVEFFPALSPPVNETESNFKWKINLEFNKTGSNIMEQRYQLNNYALTVFFYDVLNSTEHNVTIPHTFSKPAEVQPEWAASAKSEQKDTPNGFICSQNQLPLNVTDSSLVFKKLKVVAFAHQEGNDFVQTQLFEQCMLDVRTSDLVPIIVGACLAGLVIVVLIAYLIGRARAKRQGYASV